MLDALQTLSKDEALKVLSAAASWITPSLDEFDGSDELPVDRKLVEAVIQEISTRTKTAAHDPSGVRSQLRLLSSEMSRIAIPPNSQNFNAAKSRLGDAGQLHPALYGLDYSAAFKNHEWEFGVPRALIESIATRPDSFQHLNPGNVFPDGAEPISLFTRTITSIRADDYTVLVVASRRGASLIVTEAWNLFHSDVSLSKARSPLDVLAALVDAFGAPVRIGRYERKLYVYERLDVDPSLRLEELFDLRGQPGHTYTGAQLIRLRERDVEVAMMYAIDVTTYWASLAKHGMRRR